MSISALERAQLGSFRIDDKFNRRMHEPEFRLGLLVVLPPVRNFTELVQSMQCSANIELHLEIRSTNGRAAFKLFLGRLLFNGLFRHHRDSESLLCMGELL